MEYRLCEIVDSINTGQIMSRVSYKEDEERGAFQKDVLVLVPSAISGGVVHHENLGTAVLKKEMPPNKVTKKGDIAIKLSSPYDCALVTEKDEGLAVPSFCAVIRGVNEEIVDTRYLLGFLNSAYSASKLIAGINSTAMAMVRLKSLEELSIIAPQLREQKISGDAYWASCRRKQMLESMAEQQQKVSDAIIIETLKEVSRHAK